MATNAEFETAVAFVIGEEVDPRHPDAATAAPGDPGGLTKYGISQRAYPNLDIANLTLEDAKGLYFADYWQPSGAATLPMPLAQVVLDTAVNMGVAEAKHLLADSGGDVNQYLALRAQRYAAIAQANPSEAGFLADWLKRLEHLASAIGPVGGGGVVLILLALAIGILAWHGKLPGQARKRPGA